VQLIHAVAGQPPAHSAARSGAICLLGSGLCTVFYVIPVAVRYPVTLYYPR
jgi:hypothetical protein